MDNKELKLHLCCGDVYLDGYINIDICGYIEKPEKKVTLDNYYEGKTTDTPQGRIIVDKHMNLNAMWYFENNSVDEIVMICAIEHFTIPEVKHIISEAHRVLKPGGQFKFDYPNLSLILYRYSDDPEMMSRLIYGTHKNIFSIHKTGFNKVFIKKLLEGWSEYRFKSNLVKHDHPMYGVIATK